MTEHSINNQDEITVTGDSVIHLDKEHFLTMNILGQPIKSIEIRHPHVDDKEGDSYTIIELENGHYFEIKSQGRGMVCHFPKEKRQVIKLGENHG